MEEENALLEHGDKYTKYFVRSVSAITAGALLAVGGLVFHYVNSFQNKIPVKIAQNLAFPENGIALNAYTGFSLTKIYVDQINVAKPKTTFAKRKQVFEIVAQEVASVSVEKTIHDKLMQRFDAAMMAQAEIDRELDDLSGYDKPALRSVLASVEPVQAKVEEPKVSATKKVEEAPVSIKSVKTTFEMNTLPKNVNEYSRLVKKVVRHRVKYPNAPPTLSHNGEQYAQPEYIVIEPAKIKPSIKRNISISPKEHVVESKTTAELIIVKEEANKDKIIHEYSSAPLEIEPANESEYLAEPKVSAIEKNTQDIQSIQITIPVQKPVNEKRKEYSIRDYVMANDPKPISQPEVAHQATKEPKQDELSPKTEKQNEYIQRKLVVEEKTYAGILLEAFTGGKKRITDAQIRVIGTNIAAYSNENGEFEFKNIKVSGVLPVYITKDGYLSRRAELTISGVSELELMSQNSAMLAARSVGDTRGENSALVFGQLSSVMNESIAGLRIEVIGSESVRPVYLNERGVPDKALDKTSASGQFMLMNMRPGLYLIATIDQNGVEKAPHLVQLGTNEGLVRKFNMGQKMTLQGSLVNAMSNGVVAGASVQLLGNQAIDRSSKSGKFKLKQLYIDCSEHNYIQIDKSGYYRNRAEIACTEKKQNILMVPGTTVDGYIRDAQVKLENSVGMIVGHQSFKKSAKVQLWGADEINAADEARGVDMYFEKDGILNPNKDRTSANGNYVILNAPEGISYLQVMNKDGTVLSVWPVLVSQNTVNVIVQ